MTIHAYSRAYSPAISTLEIYLSLPSESPLAGPLIAIVDTGADGTLVPAKTLVPFQSAETDRTWIVSQWGERQLARSYMLDLHIGDLRLPAMRVVSDDRGNEVILGRDILNKLRLLLDGPAQTTEILEAKQKRK
ncbi:MAG: retroviral-like aspartic protease family protein [Chloroflexi bacterium]|nr:retroviral-like aspartic protease family protein [Chloroflexota bacterium]